MQTFLQSFVLVVCASMVAVLILNPKGLDFNLIQRLTLGVGTTSVAFLIAYRLSRWQELFEEYKLKVLNPSIHLSPPPTPPKSLPLDLVQWIAVVTTIVFVAAFFVYTWRKH